MKLRPRVARAQLCLDWQGADPKALDLPELRETIQAPLYDDAVEDKYRARISSQKTAIRAYCVVCQGSSVIGVKQCPSTTCPLFPFRMGKDPLRGYELPKAIDPEIPELEDDDEDFADEDDLEADDGDEDAN